MEAWMFWIAAAGVLLIAEVLTQTLWCLCMAGSCLVAMAAALCGLGLEGQLAGLVLAAAASYFLLMPVFRHQRHLVSQPDERNARTGMDALLGRTAIVTHEIRPGELGRARIDGDSWQVRAPGSSDVIERGSHVKVTGYDSIILTVGPCPADTI